MADNEIHEGPVGPAGPEGPSGAQGRMGEPGSTGEAGLAGEAGVTGETGLTGKTGPAGAAGATGEMGIAGHTGLPGRPGIDVGEAQLTEVLSQTANLRTEAQILRTATQDFADTLRRGLVRATIQGVLLTLAAIIIAISFLGYLTSKSWTCDPTVLVKQEGSVRYHVCDVAFPQVGQAVRQIKATQAAAKAASDAAIKVNDGVKELDDIKGVLLDVQGRLNPGPSGPVTPTAHNVCVLLKRVAPETDEAKTCR